MTQATSLQHQERGRQRREWRQPAATRRWPRLENVRREGQPRRPRLAPTKRGPARRAEDQVGASNPYIIHDKAKYI